MTALTAALLQMSAAAIVAGVSLAFLTYVTGTDRVLVYMVRHPLRSIEMVLAIPMSWLPKPAPKRRKGAHRA